MKKVFIILRLIINLNELSDVPAIPKIETERIIRSALEKC